MLLYVFFPEFHNPLLHAEQGCCSGSCESCLQLLCFKTISYMMLTLQVTGSGKTLAFAIPVVEILLKRYVYQSVIVCN